MKLLTYRGAVTALFAGVSSSALLVSGDMAASACLPIAGANLPPPNTTVTCTGATANQNNIDGYGTGTQTGLRVNVEAGATVSGFRGLRLGWGNSVTNLGTVSGSNSGIVSGNASTITNFGTINGTGPSLSGAIDLGAGSTVTNSGTVNGSTPPAIIFRDQQNTLVNTASGVINGRITNSNAAVTSITINNAGRITVARNPGVAAIGVGTANITNTGIISATGATSFPTIGILVATGGTVTNSGTITSDGRAIVSEGAATIINSGIITSSTGWAIDAAGQPYVSNSGTVTGVTGIVLARGGQLVNSGTITGTSGRAITFAGPSAANSLTVAPTSVLNGYADARGAGTLALGGTGAGTFDMSLVGNDRQYRRFSEFQKINSDSTWTLVGTGNQSWTVIAGSLIVSGATTGAMTVNDGGRLSGAGTVGGLAVNGGTVAPGNFNTLNVNGNVTFGPGATYLIGVDASGRTDKIAATGTAVVGGAVQVMAATGNYAANTRYTILSGQGGVSGAFRSVATDLAFLTPSLTYGATDVVLSLTRNDISFADMAQTSNQRAVAGILQGSALTNPLVQAVAASNAAGARQAFDALSGEIHPTVRGVLLDESRFVRGAVLGRLRSVPSQSAADTTAPLAYGETAVSQAHPLANAFGSSMAARDFGTTFWAQGAGTWGSRDGDSNAASVSRSHGSFFSGVDGRLAEAWRVGLAAGYSRSDITVLSRNSGAGVDTAHLAAYAGTTLGALALRFGGAYGFHQIDTSRSIAFPGWAEQAKARYDGGTGQIFGELGYAVTIGKVAIEPFAGIAYVNTRTDAYQEFGAVGALGGNTTSHDLGYSTLGVRLANSVVLANGTVVVPRATLAWQHAIGNVVPSSSLAFQGLGNASPLSIAGTPIARDAALIEAGLDVRFSRAMTLSVAYTGQISGNGSDHGVKGKFAWAF